FPPLKRSSLLLKTSEHLKVYFWERRPNFLNSDQISKMLKSSKYKVDLRVKRASDLAITEVIRGEKESLVSWSSNNNSEHLKNLEECDLFVSPREYEGIGIATLEALALGVPAISIRRPTINEYITHGKNGILFENVGDEINLDDFDIETLKQNALSMSQELQARWSDTSKTLILELIDRAKQSLAHANNKIEWDQRHTEMLRLFCTCNDDTIDQYAKYLESLT
ncbi:MAG: glycosyltransferase, partial [Proteobacteria bacterium]|nr:glycosyltransferase [Pseudomonadota bacterium]